MKPSPSSTDAALSILPALTDFDGVRSQLLEWSEKIPGMAELEAREGDELFRILITALFIFEDQGAGLKQAMSEAKSFDEATLECLVSAAAELTETMHQLQTLIREQARFRGCSPRLALLRLSRMAGRKGARSSIASVQAPAITVFLRHLYKNRINEELDIHDILFILLPNFRSTKALREHRWKNYVRELRLAQSRSRRDEEEVEARLPLWTKMRLAWMDVRLRHLSTQHPGMGDFAAFETGTLWRQRLMIGAAVLALIWVSWMAVHQMTARQQMGKVNRAVQVPTVFHELPGDF